ALHREPPIDELATTRIAHRPPDGHRRPSCPMSSPICSTKFVAFAARRHWLLCAPRLRVLARASLKTPADVRAPLQPAPPARAYRHATTRAPSRMHVSGVTDRVAGLVYRVGAHVRSASGGGVEERSCQRSWRRPSPGPGRSL